MKKQTRRPASRQEPETSARIAQEWQNTFDAVIDAIWILDKDQRIIRCNQAARQMFNLSIKEMTGKHCWEIVHGTSKPVPECPLLHVKKSHARESMELQVGPRWFAIYVDPILDSAGRNTGYVHIVSDITERKQAEDALRMSEDNYRTIFENSAEGIFQVTPEGKFINANPALARSLGYDSREELLGAITDISRQIYVDSNERKALRALLKKDGFVNNFMVQCRQKDGGIVWIQINLRLVKDQNGKILFHEGTGRDITERKQAEESLRESEDRFRKIFEEGQFGMVIVNKDFFFVRANAAFCAMLGYSEAELVSRTFRDITHPDHLAGDVENVARLSKGEIQVYKTEKRYVRKDGGIVWGSATITAVRNSSGELLHFLTMIEDITERKHAEDELRESEERFAKAFRTSPYAYVIANMSDGRIIDVNDAFTAISGFTREEALASSTLDLNVWVNEADRQCMVAALREGRVVNGLETKLKGKRGNIKTVLLFAQVIHLTNKSCIMSIVQDITERKQAEEAMRHAQEQIADALSFNRMILESSPVGMIVYKGSGECVSANQAAARIIGGTTDELLAQNFRNLETWKRDGLLECADHALTSVKPVTREVKSVSSFGKTAWFNTSFAPFTAAGENHLLFLFEDISERKKAEEDRRVLEDQLNQRQKLESLGVLAGGIAHDFNNLLTGIYGYIDLARSAVKDPKAVEYLETTIGTLNRARALTLQLLTFAKGGFPLQKITPLTPFIQDTVHFALSGSNTSRKFSLSENLWPCNIDKDQIGQVIDNIVINAQQAMPNGGDLEITAENISFGEKEHPPLARGDYVRVSIKDHGIGMPKDVLPRIFDPFYTTKTKGHGLGLATCYSITNRHGGCIDVESEQGKGSTFHVYLPASPESFVKEAAAIAHHKGGGTILVMDDEEVIRDALRQILGSMGYTVACKNEGRGAVDCYLSETKAGRKFAAMIFDLTVPGGMGGIEAVKEIRKLDTDIPVFVASGYADDPVITNPVEYGFTASISKPFTIAELSDMLNKFVKVPEESDLINKNKNGRSPK
jgi:PAS domain S-box-containing protein